MFFVLIVSNACGKKEDVVDIAAKSPIIVVMFICDYFFMLLNVDKNLFNSYQRYNGLISIDLHYQKMGKHFIQNRKSEKSCFDV